MSPTNVPPAPQACQEPQLGSTRPTVLSSPPKTQPGPSPASASPASSPGPPHPPRPLPRSNADTHRKKRTPGLLSGLPPRLLGRRAGDPRLRGRTAQGLRAASWAVGSDGVKQQTAELVPGCWLAVQLADLGFSPGLPFPALRCGLHSCSRQLLLALQNKMAAAPSAAWDRLKWRRRHYVSRPTRALVMVVRARGREIFVVRLRGARGRSSVERAGLWTRALVAPPTEGVTEVSPSDGPVGARAAESGV